MKLEMDLAIFSTPRKINLAYEEKPVITYNLKE